MPGRGVVVLVAALAAGGCATSGAIPHPYPGAGVPPGADAGHVPTRGAPPTAPVPSPLADAIVSHAEALVGTPYRAGGAEPAGGFDCSGFVQFVVDAAGGRLPRSVREQWRTGVAVDAADLAPGDLVFFAIDGGEVSHVGIALGGDRFVHAPSSRGVVRVERLSAGYWATRYLGARRIGGSATSAVDRPPLAGDRLRR